MLLKGLGVPIDVHSVNLVGKQDQMLKGGGDVFLIPLHFLVVSFIVPFPCQV